MPPSATPSPTPTSSTSSASAAPGTTTPLPSPGRPSANAARRPLPRPPHSRPGSPPPWAGLPVAQRTDITLERVLAALASERPGADDSSRRPWTSADGLVAGSRPAAVLVPLFEEDGEARVILTVRSDLLRSHQGEVAFPGGRLDGDEGVVDGALREAFEEVGLRPGLATVVGQLTALPTVSSDTVMTPVVATLATRPTLTANPGEVERVFDVALRDLVADGVFHEEWWSVPGRTGASGFPVGEFPVWFFDVAGETVWGATARTLVELVCLVLEVEIPPSLRSP
jgi:8-oxo-dGTP pyrophosphatase MutT (NUDIX family)